MDRFGKIWLAWLLGLSGAVAASAQQCPYQDASGFHASAAHSLDGQLVYHDGARKWFELKLATPQCGMHSLQLTRREGGWAELVGLRGCRVRAEGALEVARTGYYSLDLFEEVKKIEPLGGCTRQPPLVDFAAHLDRSQEKPDAALDTYDVALQVHLDPPDRPIDLLVTHGGEPLNPWQSYANYWRTGADVLYGQCAEGFYVDAVYGPAEAHPTHSTERMAEGDIAVFTLESAAAAGKKELALGFTCKRRP